LHKGKNLKLKLSYFRYSRALNLEPLLQSVTAVAVSSERSLLFAASKGQITVFDSVTAARQHIIPIPGAFTPTLLQILPGGNRLAIVCGEWAIYIHSLDALKTTAVLNLSGTKKSRLTRPVLASISSALPGSNHALQILFVANVGKDSLRTVHVGLRPDKDKSKLSKELTPGFKVALQKGKGVVALAAHPFAPSAFAARVLLFMSSLFFFFFFFLFPVSRVHQVWVVLPLLFLEVAPLLGVGVSSVDSCVMRALQMSFSRP
jgi:hypothetical protein